MFTVVVTGEAEVVARLGEMAAQAKVRLASALLQLGGEFAEYVQRTKLSGSPLKARSGTLRDSITARAAEDSPLGPAVEIGPENVPYAAFQEFGFHGAENVGAYQRYFHQVFGRAIGGISNIRAHTRSVDYAGKPYMRPALEEFRPTIDERLKSAVAQLVQP